jgi:hypothetical protein
VEHLLRSHGFRSDRTPEKRKVGGSTPPLTTRTSFDLRKRRLRVRPLAPLSAGPDAVMKVAARRSRQRDQPAAEAFPLVIGSLWSDLAVERKSPACRADERPLTWALVGAGDGRAAAKRLPFASPAVRASVSQPRGQAGSASPRRELRRRSCRRLAGDARQARSPRRLRASRRCRRAPFLPVRAEIGVAVHPCLGEFVVSSASSPPGSLLSQPSASAVAGLLQAPLLPQGVKTPTTPKYSSRIADVIGAASETTVVGRNVHSRGDHPPAATTSVNHRRVRIAAQV